MFFFFKQKTAYEMRISDWSSDVCSSDLPFLSDLGTDAGQLGTQRLQCPSVLRPASLQGLVFRRRKPQCVQLAQMVFRVLARLRQLPFQRAAPFHPLAVVQVDLQNLLFLPRRCPVGLATADHLSAGSVATGGPPPYTR